MRNGDFDSAALDALTRTGFNRGGRLSDHDLVLGLASPAPDSKRLQLLAEVSRLLRLMDGLVTGKETGEGFVSKFSDGFLATTTWEVEPSLDIAFERLNEFYGAIQRFSASAKAVADEPLLFGLAELKDRTQIAYAELKSAFLQALKQG